MPTLDYQNSDDARREQWQGYLRAWFGPGQADLWDQLAREINARREGGGRWQTGKVVADVGPWQITLDTFQDTSDNANRYSRMRAPYLNPSGFRFRVYRESVFSDLKKLFGMQDIEIGDRSFDALYIVQSNDAAKVKKLLRNGTIKALIRSLPEVMFEVKDDEGWFGARFPQGVDELYFAVQGIGMEINVLKRMFELFAETLRQLCEMGEAHGGAAGVKL